MDYIFLVVDNAAMTIPDIAIEKAASGLVDIHGDAAPAWARERMEEYKPHDFSGDYKEGYKFWSAVAKEATRLLERERARIPQKSRHKNADTSLPNHPDIVPGHG